MTQSNTETNCQQERILDLLKSRGYGQWIQLYEILDLQPRIVDIGTRIHELRHKRDLNIQNKTWRVDGITHSAYRLLPGSFRELGGKPEPTYRERREPLTAVPLKSWEQVCAERESRLAAPVVASSDLPLFAESSL